MLPLQGGARCLSARSPAWGPGIKQDIDLIREIMLRVEATKTLDERPDINVEGHPDDHVAFNVRLLINAGFVEGTVTTTHAGSFLIDVTHLTWDGFGFLKTIRHDSVLNSIKHVLRAKGFDIASVHIKVIARLALAELEQQLGL